MHIQTHIHIFTCSSCGEHGTERLVVDNAAIHFMGWHDRHGTEKACGRQCCRSSWAGIWWWGKSWACHFLDGLKRLAIERRCVPEDHACTEFIIELAQDSCRIVRWRGKTPVWVLRTVMLTSPRCLGLFGTQGRAPQAVRRAAAQVAVADGIGGASWELVCNLLPLEAVVTHTIHDLCVFLSCPHVTLLRGLALREVLACDCRFLVAATRLLLLQPEVPIAHRVICTAGERRGDEAPFLPRHLDHSHNGLILLWRPAVLDQAGIERFALALVLVLDNMRHVQLKGELRIHVQGIIIVCSLARPRHTKCGCRR
mmetsp:Transcript_2552/g.7059  ORF Transcript_2552/g.7059 Transcript_2552/m.7059 type:complete len:312 (-) Transcript_2552:329-1264(-)